MPRLLILLSVVLFTTGCMTPEQRMIRTVERHMERQAWDDALTYLEGYLGKRTDSLVGWRYRVLIRLEQGERALAAGEYADLNAALARHEPAVLREVVLGSGGRWLLSDYKALARCAPEGVADVALFTDLLEAKHLGIGSMTKVAIADDQIAAVIAALPGRLPAAETWPLVQRFTVNPSPGVQARLVAAAGRHLADGSLSTEASFEALAVLQQAARSPQAEMREAALLASLSLPAGPGQGTYVGGLVTAFNSVGDVPRAISLFRLGPGGAGPAGWTKDLLLLWRADSGALGSAAVSLSLEREPNAALSRALERRVVTEPQGTLAAFSAGATHPPRVEEVYAAASAEQRRIWAPAFVRSASPDRVLWAKRAFADSDALVTRAAADALAIPGVGDDPLIDPLLEAAMNSADPATRAAAARAAVIRGASGLSLPVEGLFARGDDRVTNDVLTALVETGGAGFDGVVAAGLRSELPMVRELAVDAAAASCSAGNKELMATLLGDDDPHVAVRAASALYLLVGSK